MTSSGFFLVFVCYSLCVDGAVFALAKSLDVSLGVALATSVFLAT